jgi:hypothetical protein
LPWLIARKAIRRTYVLVAAGAALLSLGSAAPAQEKGTGAFRNLQPGLYLTTIAILEIDAPDISQEMRAQMDRQRAQGWEEEVCNRQGAFFDFADMGEECGVQSWHADGNEFQMTMSCENEIIGEGHFVFEGTASVDRLDAAMEAELRLGDENGLIRLSGSVVSERIGECGGSERDNPNQKIGRIPIDKVG